MFRVCDPCIIGDIEKESYAKRGMERVTDDHPAAKDRKEREAQRAERDAKAKSKEQEKKAMKEKLASAIR